jgi:putative zinc finger protein
MSPRIPDTHAEAWAMLPWLANGRLSASDREWVEAHVAQCADCRGELDAQRKIATQIHRDNIPRDVSPNTGSEEQRSFNKLWARIEASEAAAPAAGAVTSGPVSRSSRTVRWLVAAVVVQGIGLALFGFNALQNQDSSRFVTVADAPTERLNAPAVRLVFAANASMADINTLLTHQGLSIVSGPGTSGNFTAELSVDAVASGASADSVAAVISKDPNVTFAQPVAR